MSNICLQKEHDKTVRGTDDAWVQIILGGEHCALLVIFFFLVRYYEPNQTKDTV
jgi:hypothetical protein